MLKMKAFTLIELLVVIAIIALLVSIIIPALHMARKKGAAAACMANVKNLSLGWFAYQLDNSSRIMSAKTERPVNLMVAHYLEVPCGGSSPLRMNMK